MDLNQLSAVQMLDGFRAGAFTPVDAAKACLARIAETASALNAFCLVDEETVIREVKVWI